MSIVNILAVQIGLVICVEVSNKMILEEKLELIKEQMLRAEVPVVHTSMARNDDGIVRLNEHGA